MLKLIGAIVKEKLCNLEIVEGNFLTKDLIQFFLNSLYLSEVFVIEPPRDLNLALVALLQINGKPKWNGDWLSWTEWSEGATNETEDIFSKVRNDLDEFVFSEKLVLCRRIVLVVHFYITAF